MKIIVAIGGSSGSIYAKILLDRLKVMANQTEAIGVVMSDNAIYNWELEIGPWSKDEYPFTFYNKMDFMAPFASGSAKYEVMLVCPCSMGLLGRIAAGISTDLTTRAADVILKERRKLIVVTREMPLSLIHIRNMETVTLAGGIICPATPSFYGKPSTIEEVAGTVIDRVLDLSGLDWKSYRWGE
ncbi:MAG: UbiX family flavin prenyltransferase [Saprospiraceae bacterium]|jgi:4-hydroxy-3-polyprenylbenzoate decarboxylase|nr:UbiX family flavin prenyltransferase [Saprospiraceae bacterium]MDP4811306.1 UbiX family flavin prenyltransferase [Saprospiraceae bacterium]MDP4815710.1 UbiX family flavin prenyltransferase [Saprospiraceae bacterium]MDP5048997.1 UbiX family flavin prenyltransferase [Saprospiraceae bacterium]MDP5089146.1 UbiX family flavin prenyltransferase [Saprospiraceae bacterium]